MSDPWYVLRSHPNKEESLWQHVLTNGIEVYYPRIPVHPTNPRARKVKAYFPGYMFIRANIEKLGLSFFQWMPYTVGLVFLGGEPATVSEELIHLLHKQVESFIQTDKEIYSGFKPGDPIVIFQGPLAEYQGIFDCRISGTERVRILLKMLNNRIVPIELNVTQISKPLKS